MGLNRPPTALVFLANGPLNLDPQVERHMLSQNFDISSIFLIELKISRTKNFEYEPRYLQYIKNKNYQCRILNILKMLKE